MTLTASKEVTQTMAALGQGKRIARGTRSVLLGVTGVAIFILALEALPTLGIVDRRYLPPASEIGVALYERVQTITFWGALGQTLTTWAIGLGVAMLLGLAAGVLIGSSGFLTRFTSSTVEFLRPIPSVALIPVAVLLYGTGMGSTLLLVVYAAFWQVFVQILQGVRDVDPVARDIAAAYRFRRSTLMSRVVFPSMLPYTLTGFRLGASIAIILTITGELIIGTPGIGNLIAVASTSGAVASMYAVVLVAGVLGLVVNQLTRVLEKRVMFWHASVRRESR